jgi:predicted ribosome quality control (RQC) complex YloA/Tae2 family protein
MLSLCELERATTILRGRVTGARLQRIFPGSDLEMVLVFQDAQEKTGVLLSSSPDFARISILEAIPESMVSGSSFMEYLRAHLTRGKCEGIHLSHGNRQVGISIQTGEGVFCVLLSILGARSNIYLLSSEQKLVHSLRPLAETRRELQLGYPWMDPEGSVRSRGEDRWADVPDNGYLERIEKVYRRLEATREFQVTGRKVENALEKEDSFLERKCLNLQEDLATARKAEEFAKNGELLKTALHTVTPGSNAIIVKDYETGERVEVALDPKLSPAQNLEAYFARYQKESRGVAMIERQLLELQAVRGELDGLRIRLHEILAQAEPDLSLLHELTQNRRVRKLLGYCSPVGKESKISREVRKKGEVPGRLLPKRYLTDDGLEILVGRSDEGNDYLSTRIARGNDLFFHLDGYPGSHVVLRTEGRTEAPANSILDACELAVHFSKLKSAGRADVHMAHIKDIKKPRGAKPGLVYVRRGKTIHLRRDPKRLQNILAARLDD